MALVAGAALLLSACLRLPVTADEPADPSAVDETTLRTLTTIEDLGVCTEEGWTGSVANRSDTTLQVVVGVEFRGFGSEVVGEGSETVEVLARGSSDFEVVPDPPTDELAISCSIELESLIPVED